ncbi:MAG: fructosamine kinase family protein [Mariprofundus sp.]|nr:fructosamine kinase family protein [Mariprofundus sp.]
MIWIRGSRNVTALWRHIEQSIQLATGSAFIIQQQHSIAGGSINRVYRIVGGEQHFLVKINTSDRLQMFEAEAAALKELADAGAIRVPAVLCSGQADGQSWLVMEFIELVAGNAESSRCLGRALAVLHRCDSSAFGWWRDNTIGSTIQHNSVMADWPTFYRERRLRVQFDLAAEHGFTGSLQDKAELLMADMHVFFADYQPHPSLLHGDLWAGNCAFDRDGKPVIFDPALYYGDRETDLAMTELFGGFSAGFYEAYQQAWPLHEGYAVRKALYNLYHILNHANLFGGAYIIQAESMIDALLAECGGG